MKYMACATICFVFVIHSIAFDSFLYYLPGTTFLLHFDKQGMSCLSIKIYSIGILWSWEDVIGSANSKVNMVVYKINTNQLVFHHENQFKLSLDNLL